MFDISLQNFKKPLDTFSLQIEGKRSKDYFVIILAAKENFERFSRLEFTFEKSKHQEASLRTVPTIVTAHIFCSCQGSRARRERNAQHAGHADWFCLL